MEAIFGNRISKSGRLIKAIKDDCSRHINAFEYYPNAQVLAGGVGDIGWTRAPSCAKTSSNSHC